MTNEPTEPRKVAVGIKPLPPIPRDHPELRERRIVPPSFDEAVKWFQRYRANGVKLEE